MFKSDRRNDAKMIGWNVTREIFSSVDQAERVEERGK